MAEQEKDLIAQAENEVANLQQEYAAKISAARTKLEELQKNAQQAADEAAAEIHEAASAAEETFRDKYGISLAVYLTLLLPQAIILLLVLFKR